MPTSSLGFIQLTRNKTAIVDIEDYDKLSAYNDKAVELFGEFALLNNIKETSSANR